MALSWMKGQKVLLINLRIGLNIRFKFAINAILITEVSIPSDFVQNILFDLVLYRHPPSSAGIK